MCFLGCLETADNANAKRTAAGGRCGSESEGYARAFFCRTVALWFACRVASLPGDAVCVSVVSVCVYAFVCLCTHVPAKGLTEQSSSSSSVNARFPGARFAYQQGRKRGEVFEYCRLRSAKCCNAYAAVCHPCARVVRRRRSRSKQETVRICSRILFCCFKPPAPVEGREA